MSNPGSRIAVIGMACRFPGGETMDRFRRTIRDGADALTDFTVEELVAAGVPRSEAADPRYVRSSPVLRGIEDFDAEFFGLSAEQADLLDPQHRLFFECAWEAMEDAGEPPDRFKGTVGVFAGCSISSYLLFNLLPGLRAGGSPATLLAMVGNEKDYLASHTAYLFGLTGPSVGVQTACSTSLTAVHLACQSLLSRECDMALAGGANVRVPHRVGYRYEEGSILSAGGRCRSYDAAADGTVFGSGAGVVVLRRLEDALADGAPISAVILGSAINNDGKAKAGFTAPGTDGQAAVIAEALSVAGVTADSIGYVEGHGTGTPIGDPIEVRALTEVFRAGGAAPGSVALGSVKAAIGHLEAAAGVAGLIAATLAVRDGIVPPLAHFRKANPLLDIDGGPFALSAEARRWTGPAPRRAGVSSFGIGGTNVHVVLEQGPAPAIAAGELPGGYGVLCVSARGEAALAGSVRRYREAHGEGDFAALCRTAALGRRHFEHRVAVVARSAAEARAALAEAMPVRAAARPRLALLFTGQGAWRPGTGRALAEALPVVRGVLDRADAIVPGVRAALFDPAADLADTGIAQPALFALQWALAEQLRAWGIAPAAVAGHSVGEFAAAASAGVFDWADGLRRVAARGRCMRALAPGGAMAAVFAPAEAAAAVLGAEACSVALAAVNGPSATVLSGEAAALGRVLDRLMAQGVAHRRLAVSHAFHSPLVEPVLAELEAVTGGPHRTPAVTLVSTLTGRVVERLDGLHWRRHAREPVRFAEAAAALKELGCTAFLEVGPGTTLGALVRPLAGEAAALSALGGGDGEVRALLSAVAGLHASGVPVDWRAVLGPGPRTSLPSYPFQRRRHWREPARTPVAPPEPQFPGRETTTPLARRLFSFTARPDAPAWLADHRVDGRVVMPGAAFAVLALAAGLPSLGALTIDAPLAVDADGIEVQTILDRDGRVRVHAPGPDGWRRHATAEPGSTSITPRQVNRNAIATRCRASVEPDSLHGTMAAGGIELGPKFRRLVEIRTGDREALARLRPPDDLDGAGLPIHPAVLDAAFQTLGAAVSGSGLDAHLPVSLDGLTPGAGNPDEAVWCHAVVRPPVPGAEGLIGDIDLFAEDGRVLCRVEGLACRPVRRQASHVYVPRWEARDPVRLPAPGTVAPETAATGDLSVYADYLPEIDRLCTAYLVRAFKRLGARFDVGETAVPGTVSARFERLLPRLWRMLEEDGIVDAGRRVLRGPDTDPERLLEAIRARFPDQAPETGMLARCGASLAEVLSGSADPLDMLFDRAAPVDGAEAVYAESLYARSLNGLVASALGRAMPQDAALRVLEIGGGTGGTTRHVLAALPPATLEYRFTDISPAFLRQARKTFPEYPFLDTGVLDIERGPAAQGIAQGAYHVVVAANVLHATADLATSVGHARDCLAPGGWLVLVEGTRPSRWLDLTFGLTEGWWRGTDHGLRPDYPLIDPGRWRALLAASGFDDVAVLTPGTGRLDEQCVILARRAPDAELEVVVYQAALDAVEPAPAVLAELKRVMGRVRHVVVATRGAHRVHGWELPDPAQAAVLGLAKAAALEYPDTRMRLVDLDPLADDAEEILAAERTNPDREVEVAWRDGRRLALRLARPDPDPAALPAFRLALSEAGLPDSLRPVPLDRSPPGAGEVEIRVAAAGVNFKDVLTTLGVLPESAPLGGECAGTVVAVGSGVTDLRPGDRVVAVAGGSHASHVTVPAARVAPLPPDLTFEQAAGLPIAGFTALHALCERARLQPGERILIHGATGGVGLHAIALARTIGAEILATAGAPWKRAYLRRLGIRHVFDSRSTGFAAGVMAATGGRGVDVVLNSLAGDAIPAGLSVLAPGGRFVEIGRVGAWTAEEVAARFPHVDYHLVSLDRVDDAEGGRLLHAVLDAVARGEMAPPPLTRFPMNRAADALRFMRQARQIGKIVLTNREPFAFDPDRAYLITGGLGGLGLAVAEWAAGRGAHHLVLVSRHTPDAAASSRLDALRKQGTAVHAIAADVSDSRSVSRLFERFKADLPPLAGVFHAAGVLDDARLADQDAARLKRTSGPKLDAALDIERMAGPLDAFVLFSSAAGLLGSPGQANHAAAATALDALAQRRTARGLPAVAIDWGAWRDIGAAARRNVGERLSGTGMGSLSSAEGLSALEWALAHGEPQVAVLPIDWPVLRARFGDALPPIFGTLAAEIAGKPPVPVRENIETAASGIAELAALPPTRRTPRLARLVEEEARQLLSLGDRPLRHDRPLNELGLDSLMAIELRNRLSALAGSALPATLLFNYPTVATLAGHLSTLLAPGDSVPHREPAPPGDPAPAADDDLLSLSEDDLDAILRDMEERHLTP